MPVTVSPRPHRRGSLGLALFALLGLVIPAGVFAAKPPAPPPVNIQILNASDWHGQIDSLPPGGGWSISDRWAEDRLAMPTLTVAAGDDFGATPPLSSFFNEIPAVLVQRMMGVQVGTFGNHNFDRGIAHLQEMINLAAAPTDADHPGAPYRYVAANLANIGANLTGVEPFAFFKVGGAKVAVIGIVNEEAPGLVIPGAFGTITVTDGVAAAEKWARKARQAGANAVIVVTHKGVRGTDLDGNIFGELIDFATDLEPGLIDVVIGDHTDIQYTGTVNGMLVHENRSKGFTYSKTQLNVVPKKGGGVLSKSMSFVNPVAPARTPAQLVNAECPEATTVPERYCDEDILEMLIPYRQDLAVLLDPKIATATATFIRGSNVERGREVAIGNLVAEGMLWFQGTDFAFVNSGGVRSPLPSSYAPLDPSLDRSLADGDPADLVLGDVYSVLPFTNTVLRRTITGAQLWEAMENGVSQINPTSGLGADGRFPQIAGFKFAFDYSLTTGCTGTTGAANWDCDNPGRVTGMWKSDGTAIPRDGTVYTLAIPSFTNQGGDSYRVFLNNLQTGENEALDAFVMAEYIEFLGAGGFPELDPAEWVDGRIVKCGPANPCT